MQKTRLFSSVMIRPSRHPFQKGFASLGNISGHDRFFDSYLRRSNADDLRRDWQIVGEDLREAIASD